MKNTILALACCLLPAVAGAQITLEHTLTGAYYTNTVLLNSAGAKLTTQDAGHSVLKLYNADYAVWKTIPIPSGPSGFTYFDMPYVSDNLFNADNNVELMTIFYNPSIPAYKTVISDEGGSTVFEVDGYAMLKYFNGAYKLFAGSAPSGKIYNLPGTLPCGHCSGTAGLPKEGNNTPVLSAPTPNPGAGVVVFQYNLPVAAATLSVFSTDGKLIGTYALSEYRHELSINTASLPNGVYYYSLRGDDLLSEGGKFEVLH